MKVIFKTSGEYKNERFVTKVTDNDIAEKKVFSIHDANAIVYVDRGYAQRYIEKEPEPPVTLEDVEKMSAAELKDYAAKNTIDLDGATKKDDIFEVIKKTFEIVED